MNLREVLPYESKLMWDVYLYIYKSCPQALLLILVTR